MIANSSGEAGEIGPARPTCSSAGHRMPTTAWEQMAIRPTRSSTLTGSKVGALGTIGEMSTPAMAIRTASATSPETRFWRRGDNTKLTRTAYD